LNFKRFFLKAGFCKDFAGKRNLRVVQRLVCRRLIKFTPSLKVLVKMIIAVSVSFAFWGYGPTIKVAKVESQVIGADVVGFLQWLVLDLDQPQGSRSKNKSQGYQPDNSEELPLTEKMIRQARFFLENIAAFSKKSNQPEKTFPKEDWDTPQSTIQKQNRKKITPKREAPKMVAQNSQPPRADYSEPTKDDIEPEVEEKKSVFGRWFSESKTVLASASNWAIEKMRANGSHKKNNSNSASKTNIEIGIFEDSAFQTKPTSGRDKINDGRKVKDPDAGSTFFVRLIKIQGNTIFSDGVLAPIIDVGEGLDMTLGVLNLYSQEVRAHYLSRGYFLAKAFVPKQEIVDGVVKTLVEEGKIGNIKVTGNESIPSKDILKRFKKFSKERIPNEKTLEGILLELNDITGVQAKSLVKPGATPGTSDVEIIVTESLPYKFALNGDNFGSEFTGRNRFGVTAKAGNVLRLADQLSLRGVESDDDQKTFQASYSIPVNASGTSIGFSYTFSEQTLGLDLALLNAGGETNIGSLEFVQPLYRSSKGLIKARTGMNYRKFSNFLLNQTTSEDELFGGFLGISGNYKDEFQGHSYFDVSLHRGFNETNENRALASRIKGEGDVTIGAYSFSRTQSAGFWDSYFVLKSLGQIASARALTPDLFYLGGFSSIRGYPLADQSGDQGVSGTLEYDVPVPGVVNFLGELYNLRNYVSIFGFVDHGKAIVLNNQPGESDASITGAGGGGRMTLPQDGAFPFIGVNASYGLPVRGPDPSDRSNGIWYVNGYMAFRFDDA
jgi:hemolysin activation/secretion protein